LVELTRAATLNPFHAEARSALGQAKLATGDVAGAKGDFQAVLADRPRDGAALRGLSAAHLANHETSEARRAADRSAREDPRNPESWLAAGRAALAQGDERSAAKALGRARDLAPRGAAVEAALGEV